MGTEALFIASVYSTSPLWDNWSCKYNQHITKIQYSLTSRVLTNFLQFISRMDLTHHQKFEVVCRVCGCNPALTLYSYCIVYSYFSMQHFAAVKL